MLHELVTGRTNGIDVLLAGGNDRSLLAAARSFARHGISFVTAGVPPKGMVAASRYVRGRVVSGAPNVRSDPDAYVEFLLDVVRRHGVHLVLPLTDRTLLACDRKRDAITAEAVLAAAPSAAVRNVLDKRTNLETARRLGVPCPPQFELERLDQLPELIEHVGFPMVLKNPNPSVVGEGSPFDFRWLVARDRSELDWHLRRCTSGAFPLFQALVTGTLRNLCCFACQGEIVAANEYKVIRSLGSYSVLREITPVSPDLRRYAELMLRELRWEGAAHLGFFVRESDGDVRYMETNGRFWSSLEASVAAGWDYPVWTYEYFARAERPRPPDPGTGTGRRSRWHYGDLEALVSFLGGGENPTWSGRSRARATADYVSGFGPRVHADVFRFDDPLPEISEHWQAGRAAIQRLARRLARVVLPSSRRSRRS